MGGLENFLMNVYRKIDRNKIQFDFLVTREEKGIFDNEIKSLGGKIYNIPKMELVGYNKYSKTLYEFFKSHTGYKVVHCHRDALCGVYLKQAKKANIEIRIAHSHSTSIIENENLKGKLKIVTKNILKKSINKYSTDFFACSYEAGKWLYGSEVAGKMLVVIRNGIDLEKYKYDESISSQIRKDLGIDKDTFLIGHVGSFGLPKNHKFLVEIIKELDKKIGNFKICLVGDGYLKNEIESLVKEYKLEDKFLFLGIRNDVNKLMMAFDLFLFPSLFEGLGIVLIEAQATGLKCLVSDKVSKEADMNCDLVEFLPIDNTNVWCESIIDKTNNSNRSMYYECVKENGYDISDVANILTNMYFDFWR